ncbi:MAG: hypothetical protein HC869_22525, partial [Rhodospirillales bacterium]|nr:hypothetical protein [Rhodospirillales bacterium]
MHALAFEAGAREPLAQGGDRQASRALWRLLLETADNDWLRSDASRRLAQLDAMDHIDALGRVVAAYRERGGVAPFTWDALVNAGLIRAVPRDPAGVPYHLGPYSGTLDLG